MHLQDKLTIDSQRRTANGYLVVNARVARADNVQLYSGHEVGKPEMDVVRVFRPASEVFSADTMKSFAHRPVTLDHPSSAVTAENWKSVARGHSDGEVARDGDFIRVSMLLADAAAIKAVEDGKRELSMGYDCSLDWTAGTSPSGEAYDAIQRGIRSNHIAIVQHARGGSELRLGDSARKELSMMTDAEKQTMRDSVRGMPLADAVALPIFDDVRGLWYGGMKAEDYFALTAGATTDGAKPSEGAIRANDAYEKMCADLATGYYIPRPPLDAAVEAARQKVVAQNNDDRSVGDSATAHAKMVADQSNAWKGGQ